jgi:hypothetical protein
VDAAISSGADQAVDPAPISVHRVSPRARGHEVLPDRLALPSTHAAWNPLQAHRRTRRSSVSPAWWHVHRASHPGGQGTYRSGSARAVAALPRGARPVNREVRPTPPRSSSSSALAPAPRSAARVL